MSPRVPLEADHPGFAEPWQAEAFALAHALCDRGLFSWAAWVEAFSAEIAAHPQQVDETVDAAYFRQWLAALETLLVTRGVCAPADLSDLVARWRRAYQNTPHGQAVDLAHADTPPAGVSHVAPRGAPLVVSPGRGT